MSRGKGPQNLRAGRPRQMLRDNLPAAPAGGKSGVIFTFKEDTHSLRIKMSEAASKKLNETLNYAVEMYSIPDKIAINQGMADLITKEIVVPPGIIGYLGEMMWQATGDMKTPNQKFNQRYLKDFCQTANAAVENLTAQTTGEGLTKEEVKDLFIGIGNAVRNVTQEADRELNQTLLNNDYEDRKPWLQVNIIADKILRDLDEIEGRYFHHGFHENIPHLGWQSLAYGNNGRWNKNTLKMAEIGSDSDGRSSSLDIIERVKHSYEELSSYIQEVKVNNQALLKAHMLAADFCPKIDRLLSDDQ